MSGNARRVTKSLRNTVNSSPNAKEVPKHLRRKLTFSTGRARRTAFGGCRILRPRRDAREHEPRAHARLLRPQPSGPPAFSAQERRAARQHPPLRRRRLLQSDSLQRHLLPPLQGADGRPPPLLRRRPLREYPEARR